ncbi:MAG: 50S ribosomal protein L10 [candidate division Zixibacteria bacterium]|nr:50S ribosomal protein L10 [candidate division Zixibacteria bacterium]
MARPEKVAVVENIREKLKSSANVFLTDYQGLDVEKMTELRRSLRKDNIQYIIAKNTLINIAAKEEGLEKLGEYLKGPTAVAFGADEPNIAAKILYESFKKQKLPIIKCFIVDDQFYTDENDLKAFATMPSKDELLVQILMGVQAPLTNLISSIEAPIRELVSVIDAVAISKE